MLGDSLFFFLFFFHDQYIYSRLVPGQTQEGIMVRALSGDTARS